MPATDHPTTGKKHIVILGAGPAGYVAALHASAAGAAVTLVDPDDTGGTCLRRGCIPTKTLVASCALIENIKKAKRLGVVLDGAVQVDWLRLRKRMDSVVGTIVGGVTKLLQNRRVESMCGHGRLIDEHTVAVSANDQRIHADFTLICTGSQPARPSVFPFDGNRVVTSDEALLWPSLPRSLIIVGGGVIACEFAFIFQSLGVDVTIIEAADRPLPAEDRDVSSLIARELRKRRIRFLGSRLIEEMRVDGDQVHCFQSGEPLAAAERALVAVGRVPNTSGLGLEQLGIALGKGASIPVDDRMRTKLPHVYAAGDVTGQLMLAHAASAQARLAVDHMLGAVAEPPLLENIPRVTFTTPEVASVGLSEQDATSRGIPVRCGKFDTRGLGKAQASDELSGMVKVIGHANSGKLLGVHIVGAHAGEMIHEAAALLAVGANVSDLSTTVHAHPTLSEAVCEAAESVFGHAIHQILSTITAENDANEIAGKISV